MNNAVYYVALHNKFDNSFTNDLSFSHAWCCCMSYRMSVRAKYLQNTTWESFWCVSSASSALRHTLHSDVNDSRVSVPPLEGTGSSIISDCSQSLSEVCPIPSLVDLSIDYSIFPSKNNAMLATLRAPQ